MRSDNQDWQLNWDNFGEEKKGERGVGMEKEKKNKMRKERGEMKRVGGTEVRDGKRINK